MKNNINITIKFTTPNKVVVGVVVEIDVAERVSDQEVIKKGHSFLVLVVHISITPYEQRCIRVL